MTFGNPAAGVSDMLLTAACAWVQNYAVPGGRDAMPDRQFRRWDRGTSKALFVKRRPTANASLADRAKPAHQAAPGMR